MISGNLIVLFINRNLFAHRQNPLGVNKSKQRGKTLRRRGGEGTEERSGFGSRRVAKYGLRLENNSEAR